MGVVVFVCCCDVFCVNVNFLVWVVWSVCVVWCGSCGYDCVGWNGGCGDSWCIGIGIEEVGWYGGEYDDECGS